MTPREAVDELDARYAAAVGALQAALKRFAAGGPPPTPAERARFRYPELRLSYQADSGSPRVKRAYGQLIWPGDYAISVTHPGHFRGFLEEQLSLLLADYAVEVQVGESDSEIPYSFALDGVESDIVGVAPVELARHFPTPGLALVGDSAVDGLPHPSGEPRPLSLFDAPRVDYSLRRLEHYTGAPWRDVQPWILFTNYQRYVEEFIRFAAAEVANGPPGTALSCPGRLRIEAGDPDAEEKALSAPWRRYQMPAYHLIRPNGEGLTLANIGVGPSNAKTITDHLAVLRPHCWLMIGHCGGLRHSQRVGDYVLAHAYLRRDKILDDRVPLDVPIPAIAEVQVALQQAVAASARDDTERDELRRRLSTGTVVSYADRNWELNFLAERQILSQSRAVAVDMESACIATQGFRMRVPYGVLLCVSDKPLHGEIKLPGSADRFYEQAISQHLRIGIAAIDLLRRDVDALHSRKLRSFDEPPFR